MINKIIAAIAENISACFKDIRIYTEEVEQGFKTPCFSIIMRELSSEIYRGRRKRLKAEAEIHYYNGRIREGYNSMTAKLVTALEYIYTDGEPVRPTKIRAEAKEDSLYITLSFDIFYTVCAEEDPDMMGEYSENTIINDNKI